MRLVQYLKDRGHDVVHTRDLPRKNETEDVDIIALSVKQKRIVISKDQDFYNYYILKGQPKKLLLLTMGNIINKDLIHLFEQNIDQIESDLAKYKAIELSNNAVTVHF